MAAAKKLIALRRRVTHATWSSWARMSPPRKVTLTMIIAYLLFAYMAVYDLLHPQVPPPPMVAVGAAVMLSGVIAAIPSAYLGVWGAEVPACGLIILGIGFNITHDLLLASSPHLPVHVLISVLLLVTRIERTWGRFWEPGKAPSFSDHDAQVEALRRAREQADQAYARALAREDKIWTAD